MSKSLLLGIDIGTSACKIALFDYSGSVVCSVNKDYPVYYPQDGYVEQEPDDWWNAVCRGTSELIKANDIDPADIACVGVDGQGWAAVAVDSNGNVLTRNPIWMDTRAADVCKSLNEHIGEQKIFSVSGNPLKAQYTTGKILWYKKNMPEVYRNADKILQSNSFIVYRMTGIMSQEPSQGYGLHCFDMRRCKWDDAMCLELGVKRSLLSDITASHEVVGGVTHDSAKRTGLIEGTPVVAGGLDAACGTLGAGVSNYENML